METVPRAEVLWLKQKIPLTIILVTAAALPSDASRRFLIIHGQFKMAAVGSYVLQTEPIIWHTLTSLILCCAPPNYD